MSETISQETKPNDTKTAKYPIIEWMWEWSAEENKWVPLMREIE